MYKRQDEKNYYEKQLIALEQQAKVQYEYYLTQTKKYDQTILILHDVNKHIKAIEGLYGAEPVSYTHLDVYKRQTMLRTAQRSREMIFLTVCWLIYLS